MAKKKSSMLVPVDPPAELPEFVQKSPLLKRQVIKRNGLARYQEAMTLLHTPALMPVFFRQLYQGLERGDTKAMEMCASIYGFIQKGSGVNIVNNIQQNSIGSGPVAGQGFQFDRIVRELTGKDIETTALPSGD